MTDRVHNHRPWYGPNVHSAPNFDGRCYEHRLPDGRLIGDCLIELELDQDD